jgi:hypothetical protein
VKRPQLAAMLAFVREGDSIVCHSMDRLGHNLDDLRKLVLGLTERGVEVQSLKENLTFYRWEKHAEMAGSSRYSSYPDASFRACRSRGAWSPSRLSRNRRSLDRVKIDRVRCPALRRAHALSLPHCGFSATSEGQNVMLRPEACVSRPRSPWWTSDRRSTR